MYSITSLHILGHSGFLFLVHSHGLYLASPERAEGVTPSTSWSYQYVLEASYQPSHQHLCSSEGALLELVLFPAAEIVQVGKVTGCPFSDWFYQKEGEPPRTCFPPGVMITAVFHLLRKAIPPGIESSLSQETLEGIREVGDHFHWTYAANVWDSGARQV